MICRSATTPTGIPYVEILTECTWHNFPEFASAILNMINATDIQNMTNGDVVDCHWYQFTWKEKKFRLIFEEWPRQCVVELMSDEFNMDEILEALKKIKWKT
jgi:hypothetical protein